MNVDVVPAHQTRLFCIHAPEDVDIFKTFDMHLATLKRFGGLLCEGMDDRPGLAAKQENEERLLRADIIALLVTPALMHQYDELPIDLAVKRAGVVRVIPIIARPVLWHISPLGPLNPLPRGCPLNPLPRYGYPVTNWPGPDQDAGWYEVAKGIEEVIQSLPSPPKERPERPGGVVSYELRISSDFENFKVDIDQLLYLLRELSRDGGRLVLELIRPGSVILDLRGSLAGYQHLKGLLQDGKLSELLGLPVAELVLASRWMTLQDLTGLLERADDPRHQGRLKFMRPGIARRVRGILKALLGGTWTVPSDDPQLILGLGVGAVTGTDLRLSPVELPVGANFERALVARGSGAVWVSAFDVHQVAVGRFRMRQVLREKVTPGSPLPWTLQVEGPTGEHLLLFHIADQEATLPLGDALKEGPDVEDRVLLEALQSPGEFCGWSYSVG